MDGAGRRASGRHRGVHQLIIAGVLIQGIESRVRQLQLHPKLGKPAREIGDQSVREFVDAPYRIFYRLRADCIEVLAVVHGRNEVPDAL